MKEAIMTKVDGYSKYQIILDNKIISLRELRALIRHGVVKQEVPLILDGEKICQYVY